MKKTSSGKQIVDDFIKRDESHLKPTERQEVVRICVQHLIGLPCGYYPSSKLKEKMAKAIIFAFPPLAYREEGVSPYCHFYHPTTTSGFLDQRLKTVRKNLDLSERKRKNQASSPVGGGKKPRKSNSRKGCSEAVQLVDDGDQEETDRYKYEVWSIII